MALTNAEWKEEVRRKRRRKEEEEGKVQSECEGEAPGESPPVVVCNLCATLEEIKRAATNDLGPFPLRMLERPTREKGRPREADSDQSRTARSTGMRARGSSAGTMWPTAGAAEAE